MYAASIQGVQGLASDGAKRMKKVLVVDDQPQIVRLIQLHLDREGFQVLTAADGEEALERVQVERPDLVILDVIMPKMDGFEVLRTIKATPDLQQTPVIMLTVKTQSADIVEGLREGAELYLPKPFHPRELVALVKRVLEPEASSL